MIITIPDEALLSAKISTKELLTNLAVYLYDKERLSIGQARKLSGLDLLSFQKELAVRNVYIKYTEEDLNKDIQLLELER